MYSHQLFMGSKEYVHKQISNGNSLGKERKFENGGNSKKRNMIPFTKKGKVGGYQNRSEETLTKEII